MLGRQLKLITTMKKLFLIVAAMFVAVSFSACSDDDEKVNPNNIVGTWQITREVGYEIVPGEGKFEKDITYPIDDVNDDYGFYYTYIRGDITATIIMTIINWIIVGRLNTRFPITKYFSMKNPKMVTSPIFMILRN